MATESNAPPGFHHSSFTMTSHAISFQSTASVSVSNISDMVPMIGNDNSYYGVNSVVSADMVFSAGLGNSVSINHAAAGLTQASEGTTAVTGSCSVSVSGTSSGSDSPLLIDSVPGIKHDTGFATEWSVDEQYKLEEGLKKFAEEPSIMSYIKIASTLQNKTVRDVALRCRWMARKRRKVEEYSPRKKAKSRKDKLSEFSKAMSTLPMAMPGYSQFIQRTDQKDLVPFEVSGLGNKAKHLLEQNIQVFSQITTNLHSCKLLDNIDLFCQARNNISTILHNMRETPGIMSQMPPLPVSLDEDVVKAILSTANHPLMFGSGSGMFLKQEPRC